ncbi:MULTISPECIES: serine/threonine-protein kinase [unclassified Azospirillum]|uniref:serine/threonine-protein kinase n=1 Tax=unclassified Azospirillum TaxID=2630922 RepID=UPI00135A318C|nr:MULTISPECIES: serine/threonine-protein kinase [unclassified Azospirillum]
MEGAISPAGPFDPAPAPSPSDTSAEPQKKGTIPQPNDIICHTYKVLGRIDSGGMGHVFRAVHLRAKTMHAVKIILPELAEDPMLGDLFIREANILRGIRHDAVVAHDGLITDEAGSMFLVMEFVDGSKLKDLLINAPLQTTEVIELLYRVASGFAAAHEKTVIHRDISPDNIIIPADGVREAKIIDFGIAKRAASTEKSIIGNSFAGKQRYASPEQLGMFEQEVGPRSDIYSLGLVLAEACIGQPIDMVSDPLRCRLHVPDLGQVPPPLRVVLERMLQPKPDDRLQTMREVITFCEAACRDHLGLGKAEAAPPPPPAEESKPAITKRRFRIMPVAMTLAGLGGLLIGIYALTRSEQTQEVVGQNGAHITKPIADTPSVNAPGTNPVLRLEDVQRAATATAAGLACAYFQAGTDGNGQVTVTGFVGPGDVHATLATQFAGIGLPSPPTAMITTVPLPICHMLKLAPPAGLGGPAQPVHDALKVKMNHPDNLYREGDELRLEITAGRQGGYLTVDYIDSDGAVVHMTPMSRHPNSRIGPGETMLLGGSAIAPNGLRPVYSAQGPFGPRQHLIMILLTPEPLFGSDRDLADTAANYLPVLGKALAENRILANDAIFFTTTPR